MNARNARPQLSQGAAMSTTLTPGGPTLRPREFVEIRDRLYALSGIDLQAGKEGLVQTRLAQAAARAGAGRLRRVPGPPGRRRERPGDWRSMVDLLTTNKTELLPRARALRPAGRAGAPRSWRRAAGGRALERGLLLGRGAVHPRHRAAGASADWCGATCGSWPPTSRRACWRGRGRGSTPPAALEEVPAGAARRYFEPAPGGRGAMVRVRDARYARRSASRGST